MYHCFNVSLVYFTIYEGRPINKLQNGRVTLVWTSLESSLTLSTNGRYWCTVYIKEVLVIFNMSV